jgi:4-diphosphocytidyl-2-C-methyl-D-erythritol kinase
LNAPTPVGAFFFSVRLTRTSACKVNFVLNILGRRPDGFHELETLFFPVPLHDVLSAEPTASGIQLSCSKPELPCDPTNLVWRATEGFFAESGLVGGAKLHLEKNLPIAAGIGAGSANAATTLLLLNELFGKPLSAAQLDRIAARLGSDVNFFLQPYPATATGRGEQITSLAPFALLKQWALLLFRPGFGVSTPWAFRELAGYPEALNGQPGRVAESVTAFSGSNLAAATSSLFNSLEAPVFGKYPILRLYQDFLRSHGAIGALMSGSGSTTFALFANRDAADAAAERFRHQFGSEGWLAVVTL